MGIFVKIIHMRTNIVINDQLMEEAKKISGLKTKKAVIEKALESFIQLNKQTRIRDLRGTIKWEGDLDEMRQQ